MHPHFSKFSTLFPTFGPACVRNLFILLASVIQGKTVNLYDLKDEVGKISEKHKTKSDSHYKRITRFFCQYGKTDLWECVVRYGVSLLLPDTKLAYLDATGWNIGKFKLHCLFLALDYEGIAVPVYFRLYNHKGVLSEQERIGFIEKAKEFCKLNSLTLVADREFIGGKWFATFKRLSFNFVIRIRKGQYRNDTKKDYHLLEKQAYKKGRASTFIEIGG